MKKAVKFLTITLTLSLLIISLPLASSCAPVIEFGDLAVSRDIDQDTGGPIGVSDVFDVDIEKLYVVMRASGVDADDIKRITIKSEDTGEILMDKSDKYMAGTDGPVEGYFFLELTIEKGAEFMIAPGKYTAEFYHNGELKDTQDFTIAAPELEILEVALANQIDEQSMAPLNITDEFLDTDLFFITAKLNSSIKGDYFEANWFYEDGELLNSTRLDIEEDFFGENYISFMLSYDTPWPAGNYSVDLYHNGNIFGQYNFTVVSTQAMEEEEEPALLSDWYWYENEDYGFGFAFPDGWTAYEDDTEGSLAVDILYDPEDVFLSFSFFVGSGGEIIDPEEYEPSSDEFAENLYGEEELVLIDKTSGEYMTDNNILFSDFSYVYEDSNGDEWTVIINYFEANNRTYILVTLAGEAFYEMGVPIYQGILNSIYFLE